MSRLVQKYGGSSVGSIERIEEVANKVIQTKQAGHQVVVVVSAMYGETDRLIRLAHAVSPHPDPREYDALLATGEQASIALLSMALNQKGCSAISLTGAQAHIQTNTAHTQASILKVETHRIEAALQKQQVVVIAGFQGVTPAGDITTLGRGGSDTTAVAVAHALKADECQIYTDVDGVYTTDPHLIPEAHFLPYISFEDMLEMARGGAKVLQMHAVALASEHQMPVRVLSTFKSGHGTLVTFKHHIQHQSLLSGIACNHHAALIELTYQGDKAALEKKLNQTLQEAALEIEKQSVQADHVILTFSRRDYAKVLALVESFIANTPGVTLKAQAKIAILSLVGKDILSHSAPITHTVSSALAHLSIPLYLMTLAPGKATVMIHEDHLEQSLRALHTTFFDVHHVPSLIT
jgi:aspartate kinase